MLAKYGVRESEGGRGEPLSKPMAIKVLAPISSGTLVTLQIAPRKRAEGGGSALFVTIRTMRMRMVKRFGRSVRLIVQHGISAVM